MKNDISFLLELEQIIQKRKGENPENSYTARLFEKGVNKIAQKVGEEAVEVVIEATNGSLENLKEESADLLFHLLVLLQQQNLSLSDVVSTLESRQKKK